MIDSLMDGAIVEIRRARALKLPLSSVGLAIELAQAIVDVENAIGRRDMDALALTFDKLRRLNEGLSGGRAAPAGG